MKTCRRMVTFSLLLGALSGVLPSAVSAAITYEQYVVRRDAGRDVLCVPQVLREDDSLYGLLKARGELSRQDFPRFLARFYRLNPHISSPEQATPGTRLLIPLREIGQNAIPSGANGIVEIPFVSRHLEQKPQAESTTTTNASYKVTSGDSLSKILVTRFHVPFGSKRYKELLRKTRSLNPSIRNIHQIFVGQQIRLPEPLSRKTRATLPVMAASGLLLQQLATILETSLQASGRYHLPLDGRRTLTLDLAKTPILKTARGNRFLLDRENSPLSKSEVAAIRQFWPEIECISLPRNLDPSTGLRMLAEAIYGEKVFRPIELFAEGCRVRLMPFCTLPGSENQKAVRMIHSEQDRFPEPIVEWLREQGVVLEEFLLPEQNTPPATPSKRRPPQYIKPVQDRLDIQPRRLVRGFAASLDLLYSENLPVSFPYGGVQISTQSNMIRSHSGRESLVDFGDLYGDALLSIEKNHFRIIQLLPEAPPLVSIRKLVRILDLESRPSPSFRYPHSRSDQAIELRIPGLRISEDAREVVVTRAGIPSVFLGVGLPGTSANLQILRLPSNRTTQYQPE